MIVWGEKDIVISVFRAGIIRCIMPDISVHIMPECGHWPNEKHFDEFNAALTGFLRSATIYGRGPSTG